MRSLLALLVALALVVLAAYVAIPQSSYQNYVSIIGINYSKVAIAGEPTNITVLVEYNPPCFIATPSSCMSTIDVLLTNGTFILASFPVNTAPGLLMFVFTVTLTKIGVNTLYIRLLYLLPNNTWILVNQSTINITVVKQEVRTPTAMASPTQTISIIANSPVTYTMVINRTVTLTATYLETITSTVTRYILVNNTVTKYSILTVTSPVVVSGYSSMLGGISLTLSVIAIILSAATILLVLNRRR